VSDYIIATASTADLSREYLEKNDVPFISYTYIIDDQAYEDMCDDETRQRIYEDMRKGTILTTSMINTYTYHEFFKKLMDTGKDVIYLDMTKKISTSYTSAVEAAKQIQEEYPNQRFYNVDTLCVSGGLGLLVEKVVELRDAGKSYDEVIEWIEANKTKVIHRFTVDDLEYLKRGGRVSNAAALIGSLLSIKPVLYVPDDGTLTVCAKARGRKQALKRVLDSMKTDLVEPDGQTVHILHADCMADAQFMKDSIMAQFPTLKDVVISNLGVIIGAHCGPGLITIFYMGSDRHA